MQTLPSQPRNVTVSVDENAGFAGEVHVIHPPGMKLPKVFVSACHNLAGNAGMGIRFFEDRRDPTIVAGLTQTLAMLEGPDVQRVEFATSNGAPETVAYKL